MPIVAFGPTQHGDCTRDQRPSATRADLTPPPPAFPGAGRSDPGLQVDNSSDQRLSAENSAPLTAEEVQPAAATGFFSRLQLVMPTWAAVPSQRVASPDERRSNVPEVALPIQIRADPISRITGLHDNDRSRFGFADETVLTMLSKIVGDDELDAYKNDLETVWEAKYA